MFWTCLHLKSLKPRVPGWRWWTCNQLPCGQSAKIHPNVAYNDVLRAREIS